MNPEDDDPGQGQGGGTKKVYIRTFGCQMNEYDSDKMSDVMHAAQGYEPTDDPEQADLILFNTARCARRPRRRSSPTWVASST
jgi:tRNA A37 methylthiotransferase MiaB